MWLSNYYIFVTAAPQPPTCGDGQQVDFCIECPDNEEGCTSDDCKFIGGKCVVGKFYLICPILTSV